MILLIRLMTISANYLSTYTKTLFGTNFPPPDRNPSCLLSGKNASHYIGSYDTTNLYTDVYIEGYLRKNPALPREQDDLH